MAENRSNAEAETETEKRKKDNTNLDEKDKDDAKAEESEAQSSEPKRKDTGEANDDDSDSEQEAEEGEGRKQLKEPRVCRVFFSSPFRGMEAERELLTKQYFPTLQSVCSAQGVQFIPVDMRWGISHELSTNAKTIEICLREIDRSDVFVGFFGQVKFSLILVHFGDSQKQTFVEPRLPIDAKVVCANELCVRKL